MLSGSAEEGGPRHAREIFDKSPDAEKKFVSIKGGTHFMRGQDKQKNEVADEIVKWLGERGLF